ncbi:hypothetical protein F4604DRAFT_1923685 [Suillus subluteus]|nr:hypothetical protein F4604DRAFT_1923685 [Suillus subluteus]
MLFAPDTVEGPTDGTDTPAEGTDDTPAALLIVPLPPLAPPPDPIFDTPFKYHTSTMLPFTTHTRYRVETLNAMGYEMKDHIVGPMPVEDFLQEFLPTSQIPNYDASSFTSGFAPGLFNSTLSAVDEQHAYQPFASVSTSINTMRSFAPQLSFIDSHNSADMVNCSSFTFNVKPDVCVYADATSRSTDISTAEIVIEFKWGYSHDAFREDSDNIISSTDNGMDTLGQITSYAAAQLGAQYRSHAFSVLIVRDRARIIRWDREGAIVTSVINYNTEPHLADFFHRYAQASPELRGVDTSVSPANAEEAALARLRLKLPDSTRMFKVSIPVVDGSGMLTLIIPQPVAYGIPPVGRGTRTCPAYDILNDKVVMFKDSWRVTLPDVLPEGETYKLLKSHGVHNIATCVAFHDVPRSITQQITQTFRFSRSAWARPMLKITLHTLHRLVLNIVGVKLVKFSSSHQLVQSIRDALIAHKDAYELAKILHRDLSVGNIVVFEGVGILIDWDLAKLITIQGPRQRNRTGTWQFMSAYLTAQIHAVHTVADDLESSLYVLLWTALKFTVTTLDIVDRTLLMTQVFDGGSSKEGWLFSRTNLPRNAFVGRKSLDDLVDELCVFFSHRNSKVTAKAIATLEALQLELEAESAVKGRLYMAVQAFRDETVAYKKEMGMKLVHSHDAVIKLYDKYLQAPGWPEDPAVEQAVLPIKPAAGRMITKSILSARVDVTPTGKKRKLDDIESDDHSGAPSLHSVSSEVGDGTLLGTGLDDLKHLQSRFSP